MWYKKRISDTNNQISRNEIQIYNDLKSRIYSFKNKENIENQRKEINDNLNDDKNKLDFLIKNNEESIQMSSQINSQMKSQISNEINSQINIQMNQIQSQMSQMQSQISLMSSQMNSLNLNFDGKLK